MTGSPGIDFIMKNNVIEIMTMTGIRDKILFSKNLNIGWFPLDKK
jgi:hypothetical protein